MRFKTLGIIAVASLAALSLAACGAAPGGNSAASQGTEIGKTFKLGYDLESVSYTHLPSPRDS